MSKRERFGRVHQHHPVHCPFLLVRETDLDDLGSHYYYWHFGRPRGAVGFMVSWQKEWNVTDQEVKWQFNAVHDVRVNQKRFYPTIHGQ